MAKENEKIEGQQAAEAAAAQVPASETPNRDKFFANMRGKHGEGLSDEELYGKAMETYDAEHEYAKKNRQQAKNLDGIMQEYPEIADMYINLADGNIGAAMLNIGDLVEAYRKGEIDDEGYKAEVAKRKKDQEEKDGKIAAQNDVFKAWCEKNGYDPEEWMAKASEQLFTPMANYAMAEAQFDALDKMLNYDAAVASAEVRGKNQNIEEQRRQAPKTAPKGGAGVAAPAKPKQRNFFDYAEAAK